MKAPWVQMIDLDPFSDISRDSYSAFVNFVLHFIDKINMTMTMTLPWQPIL